MLFHVAELAKRTIAIRTLVRLGAGVNVDVVDVGGKLFRLFAAVLARVFVFVAVHQHMLHQAAFGAEAFRALGAGVRTLVGVYEQVVFVHAGVFAEQIAEFTLDAVFALVLGFVEQDRYFGRAFYVGVANVAEELLDRLEHFGFFVVLIDDAAYVVVALQFRFVREAAIATVAAEILFVLQQLVLGVRSGCFETFAANLAHVAGAVHVDEHVVRYRRPGEKAFFAIVANEVLAASVRRNMHVVVLNVDRYEVALPATHRILSVVFRHVKQIIRFREDFLVAFLPTQTPPCS